MTDPIYKATVAGNSAYEAYKSNSRDSKKLYVREGGAKNGGREYKVGATSSPILKRISHLFLETFTDSKYIYGEKAFRHLESSNTFKTSYHDKPNPVTAESQREAINQPHLEQKSTEALQLEARAREAWKKALNQAKIIGKGLEQDPQAKMLDSVYWQEALQSDHMYGGDLKKEMERWESSGTKLDFTAWRESEGLVGKSDNLVKYCNETERKTYEIKFNGGRLEKNGAHYDTTNEFTYFSGPGSAIFVISPEGKMYAGSHVEGKFHHSSFLAGGAVKAAGEITTDSHGNITGISTKSGHYKPDKEIMLGTLKFLKEQGVDLSKIKVTLIVKDSTHIYNNAEKFLESNGETPVDGRKSGQYERDANGTIVSVYQKLDSMSVKKNLSLLSLVEEEKGSLEGVAFKENTDWNDVFEYKSSEYKSGNRIPEKWDGGSIQKNKDGEITELKVTKERDPDKICSIKKDISLLNHFASIGVDLKVINFVPGPGQKAINAQKYLDQCNFINENDLGY